MIDYSDVTETPGSRITREAASMLHTRYAYAADLCQGKDVLEVGCGSGAGLGYLARRARSVVGGDYTQSLLSRALLHYRGRIPLVRLDAHALPFREASFDAVILFEAIYYLGRPEDFLAECRRVLRPRGLVLICSVNKEWQGFNPSPFSTRYFSACELHRLLADHQFQVEIFGAFRVARERRGTALIRKLAVRFHLIPRTMRGKEFLKRGFYGPLVRVGEEVADHMAAAEPMVLIPHDQPANRYKILYAAGRCAAAASSLHESQRAAATVA